MSYGLVIPKHLVKGLDGMRAQTGVSIRKQILQAIESRLQRHRRQVELDKSTLAYCRLMDELAEAEQQAGESE